MEQRFRWVAIALALAVAVPAMGEPAVPAATKGEEVVVSLRDGQTITGAVGEWADTRGFQVIPADGVPFFVRVSEVLTIQSKTTGADHGLPSRESRHRMGAGAWTAIVVASLLVTVAYVKIVACPRGCD